MSEELEKPVEGTPPVEQTPAAPEYSDVEKQAMEKGWKPKEEYQGDPGRWRSAEVFLALDEPLQRIEKQSKELKALRSAMEAFKEHHTRVNEAAYNRALKTLKESRRQAILDGDDATAFALEDREKEIEAEKEAFVRETARTIPAESEGEIHPAFRAWTEKNPWYNDNSAMRKKADALGIAYQQEGYSPPEVLNLVEKDIKQLYADKFEKQSPKRPPSPEGSSRSGGKGDSFQMTELERSVMRKFVNSGVMSEAEYIADLKKTRGA